MKACVSNMCYSWLTFLLTFLAGRLTFFLTFSYKVRIVLISSTVFWYAGSCCWLKPARCMATGSLWVSNIVFWYVGAAAGPSWLLKPFSAYVRLTFCLCFSYVKTARTSIFGQQNRQTHVETQWFSKARCLTSKYNTNPASHPIRIGPYEPDQN